MLKRESDASYHYINQALRFLLDSRTGFCSFTPQARKDVIAKTNHALPQIQHPLSSTAKVSHHHSQELFTVQGFPTWGTCTPRGTFAYLQGYI